LIVFFWGFGRGFFDGHLSGGRRLSVIRRIRYHRLRNSRRRLSRCRRTGCRFDWHRDSWSWSWSWRNDWIWNNWHRVNGYRNDRRWRNRRRYDRRRRRHILVDYLANLTFGRRFAAFLQRCPVAIQPQPHGGVVVA